MGKYKDEIETHRLMFFLHDRIIGRSAYCQNDLFHEGSFYVINEPFGIEIGYCDIKIP